jgi:hypothetical protein
VTRWIRPLLPVVLAIPLMFALSGCSTLQGLKFAQAQTGGLASVDKVASATCSKAHAGTTAAEATYAGLAGDLLRAAATDPRPWASMPPTTIIFQCYGSPPTGDGVFVDSRRQETAAPPLGRGELCKHSATSLTCSGRIYFTTP